MSDDHDPYVYPGTDVLKNRPGIRNARRLDMTERRLVAQRVLEGIPASGFDLDHLCHIHRHLFQDVYAWAGEIRTVEIAKGGDHFLSRQLIARGMGDVHRRLAAARFLRGLDAAAFAAAAGKVIGEINDALPFTGDV